jgi:hypothetical protein
LEFLHAQSAHIFIGISDIFKKFFDPSCSEISVSHCTIIGLFEWPVLNLPSKNAPRSIKAGNHHLQTPLPLHIHQVAPSVPDSLVSNSMSIASFCVQNSWVQIAFVSTPILDLQGLGQI